MSDCWCVAVGVAGPGLRAGVHLAVGAWWLRGSWNVVPGRPPCVFDCDGPKKQSSTDVRNASSRATPNCQTTGSRPGGATAALTSNVLIAEL